MTAAETLRVAAIQMNAGRDKTANVAKAERLVSEAAGTGSQLIVLPELFNLYGDLAEVARQAEPLDGPTPTQLRDWAAKHKVWLAGSFACRLNGPEAKPVNLAVLIDPQGQIQSQYAKIHLFDIDLPGKVTTRESDHLAAGEQISLARIEWATAGLAICYDLRFPELFRSLSREGAELLLVPSAFTRATGVDHWQLLVRARAVENQAYVIAANQVGDHDPSGASFGHSLIVDPWGNLLASADGLSECVVTAIIDRPHLVETRTRLPALKHRKLN